MSDFDYQWRNLPHKELRFRRERVTEFLGYTDLKTPYLKGKLCLDVGCGSGRWTYAMQQLGGDVDSFDESMEAVKLCSKINPKTWQYNLMSLLDTHQYDFVLCWGVLHHLENPHDGFKKVAGQVKSGGQLHIMVYCDEDKQQYEEPRRIWRTLTEAQKLLYANKLAVTHGGNMHGWWDALEPRYAWNYKPEEVEAWFREEGFTAIRLITRNNINMRGTAS